MSTDQGRTVSFCRSDRQTKESLELWGGVLTLDPGSHYSITEKVVGPLRISRSELRGGASFYRSASAVRQIEQKFYIVTFVDDGVISFDSPLRDNIPGPSFALSRSSGGYRALMRCEDTKTMIVQQVFVPLHMLAPFLSREASLGKPISTADGPACAAAELVSLIFRNAQDLNGQCRSIMAKCFSLLIGQALDGVVDLNLATKGAKQRYEEIQKYIYENSTDPEISARNVARKFEISPRYLSKIMAERKQTFPHMLRNAKIRLSTQLLIELPCDRYTISDIASICGFKSNPHFHKAFRSVIGTTPQQYRDAIRLHGVANSDRRRAEATDEDVSRMLKHLPSADQRSGRVSPPLGPLFRFVDHERTK